MTLNAGAGGDTIAADDVGGAKYQRVKLALGADGTASDAPVGGGTESGVLRVTLASDSTGVISVDDNGSTLSVDDGAGSLTVDNAALSVTGGGVEASALRVTIASDSTGVVSVDDNGSSLTVDGTVAVSSITTSITPGTGASNLGKAEDAAHSSGDVGVMSLFVRQDSQADFGADGDYVPGSIDADGALRVSIVNGAGSGGTSATDGATFTRNTTSITPVGAVVESSAPTLTNGDVAGLSQTTGGALRVAISSGGVSGIAEDTASSGGEEGIAILAVRRDAASSGVSADGDFAFLSVTSDGSLRVSGSSGTTQYTEDGASAGGESLVLMGAVRRDTAASSSGTDGDYSTVNTDSAGRIWVNASGAAVPITDNSGSITVDNGGTFAVQVSSLPASTNTIEVVGDAATDAAVAGNPVYIAGRGNNATPTAMSTANDVTPFWLTLTGAQVVAGDIIDDAVFTPGTSRVQVIGFQADEASTDSVDEGDAGAPRMTLDRKVIVTPQPHTAGGLDTFRSIDLDETEEQIKATAGQVYGMWVTNTATSTRFIKFYNDTAANVTVGTTTPQITIGIPGNSSDDISGNFGPGGMGVTFSTAITVAATTGVADNDTGAPGANEVIVNVFYK